MRLRHLMLVLRETLPSDLKGCADVISSRGSELGMVLEVLHIRIPIAGGLQASPVAGILRMETASAGTNS